jgi:Maltokinase N-terminal cap domain
MALLHQATLTPSKRELIDGWLPGRSWAPRGVQLTPVGTYRFDDPAGEVGLEGFLLGADDGTVLHVPLTYRGAPLDGGDEFLVGTTDHSVLGKRWVYDACGDPVWAGTLVNAVLNGGSEADLLIEIDGVMQERDKSVRVHGTGSEGIDVPLISEVSARDDGDSTLVEAGPFDLVVVRRVGAEVAGDETLVGSWEGVPSAVLAGVRRR